MSPAEAQEFWHTLTRREREIALLIGDGMPQQAVADKLGLTVGTVKSCLGNVYSKLNIHSRTQLAIFILALKS